MTQLGLFGTILGLAVWLGSVVFLTFYVTPLLTRRLGPGKASEVLAVVNRWYFWQSWVCGVFMLAGGIGPLVGHPEQRATALTFITLTALGIAVSLYGGLVVVPRANDLRDRLQGSAGAEENLFVRDRFDHMNRVAIFLNGLVICLLAGAALAMSFLFVPFDPPQGG
ncbi:MAG TPA: DUF4149 domain-containing protein [Planctomycetota bacterium]|nr:DUF4149 domain-containing protein [Planctomycetota bacterium]